MGAVPSLGAPRRKRARTQTDAPVPGTPGFTLIETAVVLVVIGLLFVSVLQGRELLSSARYKSFQSSLADYAAAFDAFRERYNALPGDLHDDHATSDLGQVGGDGNGVISDGPECRSDDDESCRAWQHLRAAALLKGNPGATGTDAPPEHPYAGRFSGLFTGSQGNGTFGHKVLVADVPAAVARRLDEELDDGLCDSGRISSHEDCSDSDWLADSAVALIYSL